MRGRPFATRTAVGIAAAMRIYNLYRPRMLLRAMAARDVSARVLLGPCPLAVGTDMGQPRRTDSIRVRASMQGAS